MVGADRWSARFTVLAGHGPALPLWWVPPWIWWVPTVVRHASPLSPGMVRRYRSGGCRPLVGTLHRSRRAWPGATALV